MAAGTDVTPGIGPGVTVQGTFVLDPGNIATGANEDQTVAVDGARVGDAVIITPPAAGVDDGIVVTNARVSADGTITFTLENHTGGGIDVASATWGYTLIRGSTGPLL